MNQLKISVLLFCVLLASCGAIPVATDYNTKHDFSSLNTYAWLEPKQKLIIDPLVDNDLMTQRIRSAIDQQMAAKGITLVSADTNADILVSFHVSSKEKLTVSNYHSAFGYYPYYGYPYPAGYGYGFGGQNVDIRQYTAGSFIVDIVDPSSRLLLWRGVSERRLPETGTPQQRDLFVNETIRAILAQFPSTLNISEQ